MPPGNRVPELGRRGWGKKSRRSLALESCEATLRPGPGSRSAACRGCPPEGHGSRGRRKAPRPRGGTGLPAVAGPAERPGPQSLWAGHPAVRVPGALGLRGRRLGLYAGSQTPGCAGELAQRRAGSHGRAFQLEFVAALGSWERCLEPSVRWEAKASATTLIHALLRENAGVFPFLMVKTGSSRRISYKETTCVGKSFSVLSLPSFKHHSMNHS